MNFSGRAVIALSLLFTVLLQVDWAASQDTLPTPRPDQNPGVTIESDALQLNDADRVAVFRGDVVARQGTLTLRSEEMRVQYGGQGGDGDGPSIERIDASGGVVILLNGDEIRSETAIYDLLARAFEATGNVELLRDGSRVRGQRFIANLDSGESEVVGRVTVEFNPGAVSGSGSNQ